MPSNENFFESLNYSLGNEDSHIEAQLSSNAHSILAIAGSGSRLVPLLSNNPKHMTVLDLSPVQLNFARIRIEAIKSLEFDEFLGFWGYQYLNPSMRKSLFEKLKLPPPLKQFWSAREDQWLYEGWYGMGRWEQSLKKLGRTFSKWFHFDPEPLFTATSLEEQKLINKSYWPEHRAKLFFKFAANNLILDRLLYKGHLLSPGYEYEKNTSEFLLKTFIRLFNTGIARNNFFLQWIFLGQVKYFENTLPETNLYWFTRAKNSHTEINYQLNDALTFTLNSYPFDSYSFSDIVSYMGPDSIEQLLVNISTHTKNQKAIFRSFLKHPRSPLEFSSRGWSRIRHEEDFASESDRTGVYRFHIYERNSTQNQTPSPPINSNYNSHLSP